MSYINEALKKAQQEKDKSYGKFGYIQASSSTQPNKRPKTRFAVFTAVILITAAALLVIEFFYLRAPGVLNPAGTQKKMANVPKGAQKAAPAQQAKAALLEKASQKETRKQPSSVQSEKIEQLYQEALLSQANGDLGRAKAKYVEVLKMDVDHVRALNNLGVVYLAMKNRKKALELFRRAALLKKDYADPYYNIACIYAQKNDVEQSIWYLNLAASIDGEVKKWVQKDPDFKKVISSPKFKEIGKGQSGALTAEGF